MPTLRLRLTGSEDDARAVINLLQSLDGIEHVEEVADMMERMDDSDSSSAGLSDIRGPDAHELEIEAPNASTARTKSWGRFGASPSSLIPSVRCSGGL